MDFTPFIYQYGIGSALLVFGLIYGWRAGLVGLSAGASRRNLLLILGGLGFFMGLQGYLQFVAPSHPHKSGGFDPVIQPSVGTTLDYVVVGIYFCLILVVGSYFGRHNKSTRDFFFGGQRFSWWFITMSLVATTVGSYSFVKYSRIAYDYGIASSQTYLNDWFWLPLFLFGWLPIIFFSRVISVPEYFQRRFGTTARLTVTALLLVYLIGYIGINLFTMGKALHHLVGWPILTAAAVVASISVVYVTWGGQTSVIVTDLMQGFVLLLAGILIMYLGITTLGGIDSFWSYLPPTHRQAFPNFNSDPSYSMVGIFWQDAMANSAVFFFLNQGVMMRFLSAKNINEGKKAAIATMVILMPLAAIVVASGGWIGSAMDSAGLIPAAGEHRPSSGGIFFWVAGVLCQPGVFGLVMAALTAALMSTIDTLITAVAAIIINDIWRPYLRPNQPDKHYLRVARVASIGVTLFGVALVPLFMTFDSIYSAHGAFTAAVTPPLVITFLFAMLWPRFTSTAAVATLVGGFGMVLVSIAFPELVAPFSQGIPRVQADGTVLEHAKAFKFTRALYGLSVSAVIGIVTTLLTQSKQASISRTPPVTTALGWSQLAKKLGINPYEPSKSIRVSPQVTAAIAETDAETGHPLVRLSEAARTALGIVAGDRLLLADERWWFGGLRSIHVVVAEHALPDDEPTVELNQELANWVSKTGRPVVLERILTSLPGMGEPEQS